MDVAPPPCSAEDNTQLLCSALDTTPPPSSAENIALPPCSALDIIPPPWYAVDVISPSYFLPRQRHSSRWLHIQHCSPSCFAESFAPLSGLTINGIPPLSSLPLWLHLGPPLKLFFGCHSVLLLHFGGHATLQLCAHGTVPAEGHFAKWFRSSFDSFTHKEPHIKRGAISCQCQE